MEGKIFLPPGILHPHRDRDARRFPRARPQDWKFLQHDFQIRIVFHQLPPARASLTGADVAAAASNAALIVTGSLNAAGPRLSCKVILVEARASE